MALHILTSLSGSPGVTSTALTWAQVSDRPTLLIEADPAGGSPMLCIGWGGAHPHDRSILDLAVHPTSEYVERIWELAIPLPGRERQAWLVPTVGMAAQMKSLMGVFGPMGEALARISRDSHVDVLVDIGRLGAAGASTQLWQYADTVLLCTDTTLAALNTLAVGSSALVDELDGIGARHRLAVVPLLGDEKGASHRPYGAREIGGITDGVPVLTGVARDAKAAGSRVWGKRGRYPLSVKRLIAGVDQHAREAHAVLGGERAPA